MMELRFANEDWETVFENEHVAVEIGNGEKGPSIYIYDKTKAAEGPVVADRVVLAEKLEVVLG